MRTSNQLTKEYSCANNNGTAVTARSDYIVKAQCQKEVMKMALRGEIAKDFDSIKSMLQASLFDHDITFENRHQGEDQINVFANRIERYVNWEQRELIFPEREEAEDLEGEGSRDANLLLPDANGDLVNTNVPVFGEEIKVIPDYITRNGNVTTIGKIKTGRAPKKEEEDAKLTETYAYGLLGKKLYPNDRIDVEIVHLGDVSGGIENALMDANLPFMPDAATARAVCKEQRVSGTYKEKINRIPFTEELERSFEAAHAAELADNEIEVNEDCASCPRYNVCNYIEPPTMIEIEGNDRVVRSINDIHLTDEQQEAVNYRQGTVRINAGAGAGKTLVVSWRVKEMLKEGIDPKKILLITFTKAGAEEMRARVQDYCEAEGVEFERENLTMTTFNAFCQTIIDEHFEELGFTRPPRIIPEEIRMDRINNIISRYPKISTLHYNSAGEFDKNRALPALKNYFKVIKERGYTRTDNPWADSDHEISKKLVWDEDLNNYVALTEADKDILFQMYEDYDSTIKGENRIEYPDQMGLVRKLLTMHPRLLDEIGFEHIIVDEFQDTDLPQIELLQKMKDASTFKSLMCVGDDSQSIFAFRHTSSEYIINFGKYLGDGNAETGYRFDNINLVENHRSRANIIDFVNSINALNVNRVEKDLIATKDYAENAVNVHGYYSKNQEYKAVAESIKADIEKGEADRAELKAKFDNGELTEAEYKDAVSKTVFPYDIAFLAYRKEELQALGSELSKVGIPAIMMVDLPYLDNSNCAAAQTFFDSYAYKTTQGAMDYINAKGHGSLMGSTAEQIQEQVDEFMNALDAEETTRDGFIEYIKALDPEGKDECLQSFIEEKLEPCENMDELKELFRTMKLYGKESLFKKQGKYDKVCLSTIHSAKGLEWGKVYYSVDSLDEEKFHKGFARSRYQDKKEELNRMHFVAASRAKEECVCVGRYVLNDSPNSGYPINSALKAAFDILGKPMNFQSTMVASVKRQEREEKKLNAQQNQPRHTVARVQGPRALTPEEQMEYRRLVTGARQMRIEDYMDMSQER